MRYRSGARQTRLLICGLAVFGALASCEASFVVPAHALTFGCSESCQKAAEEAARRAVERQEQAEAQERASKEAAEREVKTREISEREAKEREARERAEQERTIAELEAALCVVPDLKGDSLARAARSLKRAHCVLGRVKKPRGHVTGLSVRAQSVPAGETLSEGARVSVTLAAVRRRR